MENRIYKYYYSNLLLNGCLSFNINNLKKLKKKVNLGFSEVFCPSFPENNLIFNAFALKAVTKKDVNSSFNFKKKDFIKDHKIYKLNLKLKSFKFGLHVFHKFSNTLLSGLMIKKLSFKLNNFSQIKKFSFIFEDCLRNVEVSMPSYKSKYSSYYDIGFILNSEVSFFLENLLRSMQIPLSIYEYKQHSYTNIRKSKLNYLI